MAFNDALETIANFGNRILDAAWNLVTSFGFYQQNTALTSEASQPQQGEASATTSNHSNNIPEDNHVPESSHTELNNLDTSLSLMNNHNMDPTKDKPSTSASVAARIGEKIIDRKQVVVVTPQNLPTKSSLESKNGKSIQKIAARSSSASAPSSSKSATLTTAEQEAQAMAALRDVVSLYQQLKVEWTKKQRNLEKCRELLDQLKVGLTFLMFLPTSNAKASQQELLLARDILEIGAQWSIEVKDIPSFERYMAQLKCYYLDYREQLAESAYKYQLLGLNLLFLLSQNRVAEFHTELELLPSDQIQSNVYIRHPLSLEQYLMEGSYNKIFLAKGNVPADSYNFFMDILLDTIRNEIAACLEKAYEKISLKEATRMLNLPNQQAIKEYGAKKKWVLGADNYYYFNTVEAKTENVLASTELAEQAINYARELEMIV